MPNFAIERTARLHVMHLRRAAEEGCSFTHLSPDAYTLAPLVAAHARALADLLEYFLDVEGGVDGVAATRDLLIMSAETLLHCEFDDLDAIAEADEVDAVIDALEAPFGETDVQRITQELNAETRPTGIIDAPEWAKANALRRRGRGSAPTA